MNKKIIRIICLVLSAVLVLGLVAGGLATLVSAATVYQLADLLKDGKIKPLGRTQKNAAGNGITADWSGSGFDVNVSGSGGTMTIGYRSNFSSYVAVLVDNAQTWRGQLSSNASGSLSVTIPSGKHTVRVVKESQISSSTTAYWDFTTLSFDGTIEAAPANKATYIEFIGDSITCGDGALGEYEPGVKWLGSHDSATNGYAYYTAQKLNSDYSLVARGGIGLFTGISAAEGTTQKAGMQDIYDYVSGYNQSNGVYSFSRQPDVVVIELGANDGTGTTAALDRWDELINAFVTQVRSHNPNAQIVLHSTNAGKYQRLMKLVESRKESDPKLHTFYYAYLGNGSAALETQTAGHPSAADHDAFAEALANFIRTENLLPTAQSDSTYSDTTYYISESGSDSNAGTSASAPLLTLPKAFTLAAAKSGSYAAGSRIVFQVSGAVVATNSQEFGGYKGTGIKDTAGANVPVLITTKDYNAATDNRAELKLMNATTADNAATIIATNDITFQNVLLKSYTATDKPLSVRHFYAAGHHVVFDNTRFVSSDGKKWQISADHFTTACINICNSTPESPVYASITFKNGDYTDLDRVAAIKKPDIYNGTASAPGLYAKLIIENGAQMGTVYNRYGTLDVAKAEVIINGGSVQQYVGTADGTSSARKTYNGDINLTVNGGHIYGTHFSTAGRYATINGDINTTITGGIFEITPQDTGSQYDAYFFGGRQKCIVEDINTTITGGQLYLIFDVANVDSAYYFGVSDGGTAQNVTNRISGGLFMPYARGAVGKEANMFLGTHTGNITGTLRNEISGGNFQFSLAGISNRSVFVGSRGVNWATGKIENIFGKSGTTDGPNFGSVTLRLAGGWAQVGVTAKQSTLPTGCSDTVVVSNTIYGGNYGKVYFGCTGNPSSTNSYYSFINGSIENKIYGGFFQNYIYCAGDGPVYGHVKTDIYGGHFKSIYGGTETKSTVYDGVELNIYGMDEYWPVGTNSWVFCAGNASGSVPVPATAGRDAIKLTVAPEDPTKLTLNTPLQVGSTNGTTSVSVSGGVFPQGFGVTGKTVGEALAPGCTVFDNTGKKVSYAATDASVSGAVVVASEDESFGLQLVYYVSEQGSDSNNGATPTTAKKTLVAAFDQARADNNGSYKFSPGTELTIYVEGTVYNKSGSSILGGGQVFLTGGISSHMPITIATYNYTGKNPATIITDHKCVNDGNASMYVVNDLKFKDINVHALTNTATGYVSNKLYAAGCSISFDNVSITNDGKATAGGKAWCIYADHYGTGGFNPLNTSFLPLYGTVTFKNGDYTNLARVAAVGAPEIWVDGTNDVDNIPKMFCKVVIDEGAKMSTVYNTYGVMKVGSATVEVKGGEVAALYGTGSGSSTSVKTYGTPITTTISGGKVNSWMGSGDYVNINADVTNTLSAGGVAGTQFCGLGSHVTLNGNLTNNISGGKMVISAVDSENNGGHGIWLAGRDYVTINGNVVNNISGGELGVKLLVDSVQTGIWMGMRENGKITGNLTNNISGGTIYTRTDEHVTAEYADFHAGIFSGGVIVGTLTNNITGGTFEIAHGNFYLGQQGVSGSTGKIVNILGDRETGEGPTFKGTNTICLGGGFGRIGVTSNIGTLPAVTDCTDTVVVSNTIYGGTYGGNVHGTNASTAATHVTYIKGSVQTDVYGGTFGSFYGTGGAPTYGHVTTNIHGGTFRNIYGGYSSHIYDGLELNIYGLDEGCDPATICAATKTGNISARTAGRDALKLNIAPTGDLTISSAISVLPYGTGTVTGNTKVTVSGGTYTKGFSVNGVTVEKALAEGLAPVKADGTVVTVDSTMTTTGTEAVTIKDPNAATYVVGDFDGDDLVTDTDVIWLLWHTVFPGDYPLNQGGDFDGDGLVTDADVIYLLWHTVFPEDYPLNK